jgi:hypothetical protein
MIYFLSLLPLLLPHPLVSVSMRYPQLVFQSFASSNDSTTNEAGSKGKRYPRATFPRKMGRSSGGRSCGALLGEKERIHQRSIVLEIVWHFVVNGVLTQVHCRFQFVSVPEEKESMNKSQSASRHQVIGQRSPDPTQILDEFVSKARDITKKSKDEDSLW